MIRTIPCKYFSTMSTIQFFAEEDFFPRMAYKDWSTVAYFRFPHKSGSFLLIGKLRAPRI